MTTPAWYEGWREEAFDELRAKQKVLAAEFGIGSFPRFDYNLDHSTLTFSDNAKPKVAAQIAVIGTTSEMDWLWGWANESLPPSSVSALDAVRRFGMENGIDELNRARLVDANVNGTGWMATAAALRILKALGAYRAPTMNGGAIFLAITSIEHAN